MVPAGPTEALAVLHVTVSDQAATWTCQEALAADCASLLGVDALGVRERSNATKQSIDQDLDVEAVSNLKRFLVEDYQCLAALWSLGALSDQQFWRVMTSSVEA